MIVSWGVLTCARCARSTTAISVDDDDGVIRIAGMSCPRCLAPSSARWIFRGGSTTTEARAIAAVERWQRSGGFTDDKGGR